MASDSERVWAMPLQLGGDSSDLSDEAATQWAENGFCLVDSLLPIELLERVKQVASSFFPAPGSDKAKSMTDFGGGLSFPSTFDSVNEIPLHPNLLRAVGRLLHAEPCDIRLTQAEVWPKYGYSSTHPESNSDQRMHCDYPNHTLLVPPPWDTPEVVEMIIYLNDVEECDGATAVVPREGASDPAYQYPCCAMPGFGALEWKNNRAAAEEYLRSAAPDAALFREANLYPREQYAKYKFGTVLLYRHDTWHRGTELKPGCLRIVVNLTYRKAQSEWISTLHQGWTWSMYRSTLQLERLVALASVEQRCVLGFPPPGHAYFTPQTLRAVTLRYGPLGFDPSPYLLAAGIDSL